MSYSVIGSSQDGYLKTPTLSQLRKDSITVPEISPVVRIFKPSLGACWSFLTEFPYKVNVYKQTGLFQSISDSIDDFRSENIVLAIRAPEPSSAVFELVILENESATWEITDWGYVLTIEQRISKTKRSTRKTA